MFIPNPKGRMTPKALLDVGIAGSLWTSGSYFGGNKLFKICEGLGNFGLTSDGERAALLRLYPSAIVQTHKVTETQRER